MRSHGPYVAGLILASAGLDSVTANTEVFGMQERIEHRYFSNALAYSLTVHEFWEAVDQPPPRECRNTKETIVRWSLATPVALPTDPSLGHIPLQRAGTQERGTLARVMAA